MKDYQTNTVDGASDFERNRAEREEIENGGERELNGCDPEQDDCNCMDRECPCGGRKF